MYHLLNTTEHNRGYNLAAVNVQPPLVAVFRLEGGVEWQTHPQTNCNSAPYIYCPLGALKVEVMAK